MAAKIKLYVEPEKEIRVFALDASANFAALDQRVRELIGRDSVRLYWIDSEGDHIVLASDEEFNEAKATNQSPLRLVAKPGRQQGASGEKKVHAGVTCDGCQGPVTGSRYKCLECPDYDLCEKCEPQGKHSEHEMIVIRNPDSHEWKRVFGPRFGGRCGRGPCGPRGAGGPCGGRPHGPRPGCGRRMPPFMAPFMDANLVDMDIDMNKPFPEIIAEIAGKVQEKVKQFHQQQEQQQQQQQQGEEQPQAAPQPEAMQTEEKVEIPIVHETPTVVKNVETHVAETVVQRPQVSSAEVEGGWTKLQAEPVEETKPIVQDEKPQPQQAAPGETKIDAALRAMQDMGFPNESGLLRRLLQNYNGDIGRVLDSLK